MCQIPEKIASLAVHNAPLRDSIPISEDQCKGYATYPEPWNGWRLVAGWTIGWVIGWSILLATAYGLFALASWARATW